MQEECPMCKGNLKPLNWGSDDRYVAADDFDGVIGYAECERCEIVWRIDYAKSQLELHALLIECEKKCERWKECKGLLIPSKVYVLNSGDGFFVCDEDNDVVFRLKMKLE